MKHRRILTVILALALMLAVVPGALATIAPEPSGGSCPSEDAANRNGGKHFWYMTNDVKDPTCDEDGYTEYQCVYCKQTQKSTIPALGHSWSEWDTTVQPTCGDPGERVRICQRCQKTQKEAIANLGHSWGDWTVTKQATCTEAGERARFCQRCQMGNAEAVAALGHDWGDWTNTKQPTCTEAGERTRACKRCQTAEKGAVEALGHDWGDWVTTRQPTCTDAGLRTRACKRCQATVQEDIAALGHSYSKSSVTREPTCAREGERQAKCTRCGRAVTDPIPKTDHTWGGWSVTQEPGEWSAGIETRRCAVCGATITRDAYMQGTVRQGDRGEAAKKLQELLNAAGYDCGTADGIAGKKTTAAVMQAEADAGAPQDGIGWVGLQKWLSGEVASPYSGIGPGGPDDPDAFKPEGIPISTFLAGDKADFSMQVDAPDQVSGAAAGNFIPVTVTVQNTGGMALHISGFSYRSPSEGIVSGEDISGALCDDEDVLQPSDKRSLTYSVCVTDGDLAAGQVVREFGVGVYGNDGEKDIPDSFLSQDVVFTILLGGGKSDIKPALDMGLTLTAGLPDAAEGGLGDTITVPMTLKNTGSVAMSTGTWRAYDGDGDSTHSADRSDYRDGTTSASEEKLAPGGEIYTNYTITVRQADVDAGVIYRKYYEIGHPWVKSGSGEHVDNALSCDSNVIEITLPLRTEPLEPGALLLAAGAAVNVDDDPASDGALGEWLTVPLTLTNTGSANIFLGVAAVWTAEDDWQIDTALVQLAPGGTGDPRCLERELYINLKLGVYVSQADVDAGVIERQVYVIGCTQDEAKVVSNTVTVSIPLRPTQPDDGSLSLALSASVPEGMAGHYVGEQLNIPVTLKNTGTAPACFTGWSSLFADESPSDLLDALDVAVEDFGTAQFLEPDKALQHGYVITVTEDDIAAGTVERSLEEFGQRWINLENPSAKMLDEAVVASNKVFIQLPISDGKPDDGAAPELVLSMVQVTPAKTAYKPGEEVEFNWTLTNKGGADCAFGGLLREYTDKDGNGGVGLTFVGSDSSVTLKAGGGSVSGTNKFTLSKDELAGGDSTLHVRFRGFGFYPGTETLAAASNDVPFDYPLDDYAWDPTPDTKPADVTVEKRVLSSCGPEGYALLEQVVYAVRVTNTGSVPLAGVEVGDPIYVSGSLDHVLGTIANLQPKESKEYYFTHTVEQPDVDKGHIENIAYAMWTDPGTGDPVFSYSKPVTVPVSKEKPPVPPVTAGVLVIKNETSVPKNGSRYAEGETISYEIMVVNDTDDVIYDLFVDDPLKTGGKMTGYMGTMAVHTAATFGFSYTVTGPDCEAGSVINSAVAYYADKNGKPCTAVSNTVTSLTAAEKPDTLTKKAGGLTLTKAEVSKPQNGSYYTDGETIVYEIVAVNAGKTVLSDVCVYDSLNDEEDEAIGTAPLMHPGEARTFSFSYTLNVWDERSGYVENYAIAFFMDGSVTGYAQSNHVISPAGAPQDNPPPAKPTAIQKSEVSQPQRPCTRTLTGKGEGTAEYELYICPQHQPLAQQAQALVSAAPSDAARLAAWKQARGLWQAAIDEMYDALYASATDAQSRVTVLNERMMFYAQANVYEASLAALFPQDGERVAQRMAHMMQDKCADLCYETSTAPAPRADSLLGSHTALAAAYGAPACGLTRQAEADGSARCAEALCMEHTATDAAVSELIRSALTLPQGQREKALTGAFEQAGRLWQAALDAQANARYRAVSQDARQVVAAERTTFGNWLRAREELLRLLYPDDETAVREVIARTIMERAVTACADAAQVQFTGR